MGGQMMIETEEMKEKKKYYPRAYKRLILQNRDIGVMQYCLEQKFVTVEQVAKRFFRAKREAKYPLHTAYRRMLILQKFGMVKLVCWNSSGGRAMQTTKLGEQELKSEGLEPPSVCEINPATAEHDRRVTDVRIIFEQLNLSSSWRSDRYLKSGRGSSRRVPDAVFDLKNGQRVSLEVEIAQKAKERYRDIFDNYRGKQFGNIEIVFYVCNTMTQLKSLAEMTEAYSWVYYAMYDQLMNNQGETVFANKTDKFRLRELVV